MNIIATNAAATTPVASHHCTTRRRPALGSDGTNYLHRSSKSLWPMEFRGEGWEWGSITSRLQLRAVGIMQADPSVIAVTTLEVP